MWAEGAEEQEEQELLVEEPAVEKKTFPVKYKCVIRWI